MFLFYLTGKLIEDGKLDIDKPIQSYLKDFKPKKFNGKPVTITTKQLLSHTSGIRGYFEDPAKFSGFRVSHFFFLLFLRITL